MLSRPWEWEAGLGALGWDSEPGRVHCVPQSSVATPVPSSQGTSTLVPHLSPFSPQELCRHPFVISAVSWGQGHALCSPGGPCRDGCSVLQPPRHQSPWLYIWCFSAELGRIEGGGALLTQGCCAQLRPSGGVPGGGFLGVLYEPIPREPPSSCLPKGNESLPGTWCVLWCRPLDIGCCLF